MKASKKMKKYLRILLKFALPILLVGLISMGAVLENTADRPLAFVQKFKPSVGVQKAGQMENIKERGMELYNGDTLRTDENGFALVQFMDNSMAKVKPESRLIMEGKVENKQNISTRIGLEAGEIFLNVTQQGADNFEVATNTTVASVKGTEFGATADDYFWVKEGEVELSNNAGETATITDRMYGEVQEDGSFDTGELSEEEIEERDEEYEEMNSNLEPEIYELQFIDSNGQVRVIEVKVFENDN